jgi:hypothetical protein
LTDETGTGANVFATNPILVTPNLGTPSAGTLSNCGSLPINGIAGLGANVGAFLATPTSANLAAALTDETGTGANVFAASPALSGVPTAPTATLGAITTQLANTAFVYAQSFGNGQTWQDVYAFRAYSTTYTNSTHRPIMVNVVTNHATNNFSSLTALINGVSIMFANNSNSTGGASAAGCIIVPVGATYSITSNGPSLRDWVELR